MLYDQSGNRKYLVREERIAFITAANACEIQVKSFCLTLAYTGGRISEVLALVPRRVDVAAGGVILETLKRRHRGIYRFIPVPTSLLEVMEDAHGLSKLNADDPGLDLPLWPWCRTTAWTRVKEVMLSAGLDGHRAMPKGLRHSLGVLGTVDEGVPLNMMQRWLGHARIETTSIYATAVGAKERELASRLWS